MKKTFKTRFVSLLLVLMLMAVALQGCAGDKKDAASLKDTITFGIAQDLEEGLDPHKVNAAGTREVLFNIYEGLVKYDENGNLNPAVASDYVISEDGLTYTFTLRDGILFHDGSKVTVDDVIYSINRCAGADGNDPLVPAFSNIKSIEATDDKTVVITLNETDTDFLAYMTTAIIPESNDDPSTKAVGTGPYTFVERVPQESITLKAFDSYWGEKAHIENVVLKICANSDSIVMELLGGSIDVFPGVTADMMSELENSDFVIEEGTMNLVQALYLNNKVEPFNDVRVRQALCYAIDPQEIMDFVSDGKGTEIGSSMYPSFGKYFDASLNDTYNQNIDKAKELLAEAGYPNGFSFAITVPSNYQQHVDTAQVLVEEFKAIGVDASINLVEWDTWLSDTYIGRNYEATVIGVDATQVTASALLERFTTDSGKNFVNYSNADYDAAYAEASSTTDDEIQTAAYKKCIKILSEDAANVYIQDMPKFVAVNKDIAGYKFYPLYVQDYASLYFK